MWPSRIQDSPYSALVKVKDSFPVADFKELDRIEKIGLRKVSGVHEPGRKLLLGAQYHPPPPEKHDRYDAEDQSGEKPAGGNTVLSRE